MTMTPEAQRIAIAKACGHNPERFKENEVTGLCEVDERGLCLAIIPDYLNDLNAMHEAEEILFDAKAGDYDSHLWLIINRDRSKPAGWHATAAQRAEAFLRTCNLWKEEA